ncbi:hypothetical protein K1719_002046 [Acacia pycnantha]|nr:hypothetical protein K1719_002046 [Acacia pycnantha]
MAVVRGMAMGESVRMGVAFVAILGVSPYQGDCPFQLGVGGERERKSTPTPVVKKVERRPVSISFKEKLLSPGGLGFLVNHDEEDDIVSGWRGFFAKQNDAMEKADREKEASRDETEGDVPPSQYPVLSMTEEQYTSWCRPWMNSLIIKVLGLSVPRHVLFDRVRRMWKPQQPLKVVPLNNGYFIVSFSNKEDRDYAFSEGPWMIDDHYLLVQRWRPNFNPWRADCQRKIAVWIRIPDLPMEFCTVESLGLIGNMIGKIVKIDRSTSIYEKGGFARICVEIDLQTPLLPAFKVFGEVKQLVYEGLHLVCFGCGKYGHERMVCPDRARCKDGQGVVAGGSVNNGQTTCAPTEGDKTATTPMSASAAAAGGLRSEEISQPGGVSGSDKEELCGMEESERTVTGKREQARRMGKRMVVDDTNVGVTSVCLDKPVPQRSGDAPPVATGRHEFLGPQMLLRRDFRRGHNGLEGIGGVNSGSGIKKGIVQDNQGVKTQGSREVVGESRGVVQKGNKQPLINEGDLKKSKLNLGPMEKPKSEWVMVGSKRKKEEKPKFFGKENRFVDRPKLKMKEAVDKGGLMVEISNQYSSLPAVGLGDVADKEVLKSVNPSSEPLVADIVDEEMDVGAQEQDNGVVIVNNDPKGSGLAHSTLALSQ